MSEPILTKLNRNLKIAEEAGVYSNRIARKSYSRDMLTAKASMFSSPYNVSPLSLANANPSTNDAKIEIDNLMEENLLSLSKILLLHPDKGALRELEKNKHALERIQKFGEVNEKVLQALQHNLQILKKTQAIKLSPGQPLRGESLKDLGRSTEFLRVIEKNIIVSKNEKEQAATLSQKNLQSLDSHLKQTRKQARNNFVKKTPGTILSHNKMPCSIKDAFKSRENFDNFQTWAKANFESTVQASKQSGVGNCEEAVMLALEYCQKFPDLSVEIFHWSETAEDRIRGIKKDHVFLVIGRDQSQPLDKAGDIDKWGPSAVICDPWARKYFKADKESMKQKLMYIESPAHGYGAFDRIHKLQKFDPSTDKLNLIFSKQMLTLDPNTLEFPEPTLEPREPS